LRINEGTNIWFALAADVEQYILFHEKRARHAAVKDTEKESISISPEACHKTN